MKFMAIVKANKDSEAGVMPKFPPEAFPAEEVAREQALRAEAGKKLRK